MERSTSPCGARSPEPLRKVGALRRPSGFPDPGPRRNRAGLAQQPAVLGSPRFSVGSKWSSRRHGRRRPTPSPL